MSKSNDTPLAILPDGYTRTDGYIQESPRLHPALRFTYRPVIAPERAVVQDSLSKNDPRKGESIAAELIAKRVSQWDARDENGDTIPITSANALRLQPKLGARLFSIIMGYTGPDESPDARDSERTINAAIELAAALAGETIEEYDAKN